MTIITTYRRRTEANKPKTRDVHKQHRAKGLFDRVPGQLTKFAITQFKCPPPMALPQSTHWMLVRIECPK
jgi:hypothetical protein